MLPGAIIKKMDTGIADETNKGGRPRVYQNNAEKMRRRRTNEAEKRATLLAEVFTQKRRRMHLMKVVPHQKQQCSVTKPL